MGRHRRQSWSAFVGRPLATWSAIFVASWGGRFGFCAIGGSGVWGFGGSGLGCWGNPEPWETPNLRPPSASLKPGIRQVKTLLAIGCASLGSSADRISGGGYGKMVFNPYHTPTNHIIAQVIPVTNPIKTKLIPII